MIAMDDAWDFIKFEAYAAGAQAVDPKQPIQWQDPEQSSITSGAGAGALGSLRARWGPRWRRDAEGNRTWNPIPRLGDPAIHEQMNASKTAQNQLRASMRSYYDEMDKWRAAGGVSEPPEKPTINIGPGNFSVEDLLQQPRTGGKQRDPNRMWFGHATGMPFSELKKPASKPSQIRLEPGPILPRPFTGPASHAEAAMAYLADRWHGQEDKKAKTDASWRLIQLARLKEAQGFLHPRQQKQFAQALHIQSQGDPHAFDEQARLHGYSTTGQAAAAKRADILQREEQRLEALRLKQSQSDEGKEEEEEEEVVDDEVETEKDKEVDDPESEVPKNCERCGREYHHDGNCTRKNHLLGHELDPPGSRKRDLGEEKFDTESPHWLEGAKKQRTYRGKKYHDYRHLGGDKFVGATLMGHLQKIHPDKYLGAALPYEGTWSDYVMQEMFQNPAAGSPAYNYAKRISKNMTAKGKRNQLLSALHGESVSGKATDFAKEPEVAEAGDQSRTLAQAMEEAAMRRRGTEISSAKDAPTDSDDSVQPCERCGREYHHDGNCTWKTDVNNKPLGAAEEKKCERCGRDYHNDGNCTWKTDVNNKPLGKSFDTVDPLVAAWGIIKAR